MNDYLAQFEVKEEINKQDYQNDFRKKYLKDSLPFNLLIGFLVLMVGILLIRSKEIVWYKFIIFYVLYILVVVSIDQVHYCLNYKALLKQSEKNKQIYTIYKDHIEIVRNDSDNVRIFKFEDASEISYRENKNRFRFVFSDGRVVVYKDKISKEVFDYLLTLSK